MGVDQAGHDQPPAGIYLAGAVGRGHAGRADFTDGVALDQNIGEPRLMTGDIEQPSATNDLETRLAHGSEMPRSNRSAIRPRAVRSSAARLKAAS